MSNPPENRANGPRAARAWGATAVGAYVPKVARAAFEAHGFPSAGLLADWPDIIGPEFARITAPERLVWPRNAGSHEADGTSGRNATRNRRSGATLVLRVEGPRALEVQHMATQLLERINIYFGYRAVAELRLVQGPVRRDTPARKPEPSPREEREETVPAAEAVGDEGLRAALSRLAARLDRQD